MTNIDELIGRVTRLSDDVQEGRVELYNANLYYEGCLLRDAEQLLDVAKTLLCRAVKTKPEVKP